MDDGNAVRRAAATESITGSLVGLVQDQADDGFHIHLFLSNRGLVLHSIHLLRCHLHNGSQSVRVVVG